jgi:hypothetical protein
VIGLYGTEGTVSFSDFRYCGTDAVPDAQETST